MRQLRDALVCVRVAVDEACNNERETSADDNKNERSHPVKSKRFLFIFSPAGCWCYAIWTETNQRINFLSTHFATLRSLTQNTS